MQSILIKHLRDIHRSPFATIVGTKNGNVGVSVCCQRDHFDKHLGVHIAEQRAIMNHHTKIPNRNVDIIYDNKNGLVAVKSMYDVVYDEIDKMKQRARKYFHR